MVALRSARLRPVVALDDDHVDVDTGGRIRIAAAYSGERGQSSAAWYDGSSRATLRLRLVPSGFTKRPGRTRKRPPNAAIGAASAAT